MSDASGRKGCIGLPRFIGRSTATLSTRQRRTLKTLTHSRLIFQLMSSARPGISLRGQRCRFSVFSVAVDLVTELDALKETNLR